MENDRLLKLVEAYQKHFKQYNRPDYNETEVRNDFVNPFFEILGWDVQNKKNLPQHLREVKHEALIQIEDNKLDGLISKLYGAENCRREDLDEE